MSSPPLCTIITIIASLCTIITLALRGKLWKAKVSNAPHAPSGMDCPLGTTHWEAYDGMHEATLSYGNNTTKNNTLFTEQCFIMYTSLIISIILVINLNWSNRRVEPHAPPAVPSHASRDHAPQVEKHWTLSHFI